MPKRILQGVVTSDKNEQTITVLVERRFKHPVLQKTIRKSKKYRAHDEHNQFKTGDTVRIEIDEYDFGRHALEVERDPHPEIGRAHV